VQSTEEEERGGVGTGRGTGKGFKPHPIANVLQSAAGEMALMAIWSIVLAERCSDVVGSKRMTFPCELPV
jgi:hypothetical protein